MKLVKDTIKIDSRDEIDTIQDMIDAYITAHPEKSNEELKQLKKQLDGLWYQW